MGFLKRLFGDAGADRRPVDAGGDDGAAAPDEGATTQDGETARERELLQAEAERLADDLFQRQLRYADRSWTPPAQGGSRRSDDEDAAGER
jgi:hypothetical protein